MQKACSKKKHRNFMSIWKKSNKDEHERMTTYFEYIRKIIDKREEEIKMKFDLSLGILYKRLTMDTKILDK